MFAMKRMLAHMLGFLRREDGPTAIESAFFFMLVVLVCVLSARLSILSTTAFQP
jgi:Flp pilus assembly pilin Flp